MADFVSVAPTVVAGPVGDTADDSMTGVGSGVKRDLTADEKDVAEIQVFQLELE